MLTTRLELVLRFPPDGKAGLAVDTDNLVVRVTEGGAAAAAGLRVDDLIVKAGGKAVGGSSGRTAAQAIGEAKGELSIALSVTRATAKTAAAAATDAAAAASAAARQFDGGLTASMEAAAAQAAREGLPVLRLRLPRGDEGDLEGVGLTLKRGVVAVVFPRAPCLLTAGSLLLSQITQIRLYRCSIVSWSSTHHSELSAHTCRLRCI